ncbi:MAG TPA: hypothetical protein VJR29_12310 [bacterium]|nr:hypothetical protein [bacterium]
MNSSRLTKLSIGWLGALGLALIGAPALAGNLQIVPVFARAEVVPTSVVPSTCQGLDGTYNVVRIAGQGPITSEDPRMEGTFFADAIVLTNAQGKGVSRDNFKIRDSRGRLKVLGSAIGIHNDPQAIHAQAKAWLADGSRFHSESTVRLPAPGSQDPIVVEYGGEGSGDPADRGVILSGTCGAIFDAFDD